MAMKFQKWPTKVGHSVQAINFPSIVEHNRSFSKSTLLFIYTQVCAVVEYIHNTNTYNIPLEFGLSLTFEKVVS